jgi:hypothetical protein
MSILITALALAGAQAAPAPAPLSEPNRVTLTAEIKESLYRDDPLVKAVIDELGGEIVKLEANN